MKLSSSDICKIIETCAAKGVTQFKISKDIVEVNFGAPEAPEPIPEIPESVPQATLNQAPQVDNSQTDQYVERDSEELDQEDELAELQISNPLEYEDRLVRGEIKNAEIEES